MQFILGLLVLVCYAMFCANTFCVWVLSGKLYVLSLTTQCASLLDDSVQCLEDIQSCGHCALWCILPTTLPMMQYVVNECLAMQYVVHIYIRVMLWGSLLCVDVWCYIHLRVYRICIQIW